MAKVFKLTIELDESGEKLEKLITEELATTYRAQLYMKPGIVKSFGPFWVTIEEVELERIVGRRILSPHDATILAVIADHPGMSTARFTEFVNLAYDRDEVEGVGRLLLKGGMDSCVQVSPEHAQAARALQEWVRRNRTVHAYR